MMSSPAAPAAPAAPNAPLFVAPAAITHATALTAPCQLHSTFHHRQAPRPLSQSPRLLRNSRLHGPPLPVLPSPCRCSSESPPQPPPASNSGAQSDISASTALSSAPTLNEALAEVTSRSLANLSPGGPPNLAFIYVSVGYSVSKVGPSGRHSMDLVVPRLRALIPTLTAVLGCTVDGVMGLGPMGETIEVDNAPGVSLTLLRLPCINITPFHVMPDDLPSPDALQGAWHSVVSTVRDVSPKAFIVLSDPTFATRGELDRFLSGISYAFPDATVAGALASAGATFAHGHLLCTLPRDVLSADATSLRDSGCVGVALSGDIELDCLVSPGGRGIGPELEVRKIGSVLSGNRSSNSTTILELELVGRPSTCLPAAGHLKSLQSYATPTERRLLQDRLHVGFYSSDGADSAQIRHVIGVDQVGGGVTIAAQDVRVGQRMRFFVLDTEAAVSTLNRTIDKYKRVELANSLVGYSNPPFGALVFADGARGRGVFREPRMETRGLASVAQGLPIAGAFSGGQIGPPGSQSVDECTKAGNGAAMLHTAANLILLFRKRSGMLAASDTEIEATRKQIEKAVESEGSDEEDDVIR